MTKRTKKPAKTKTASLEPTASPPEAAFDEIVAMIEQSRQRALQAVNTGLIDLYWRIGDYLHHKIATDGWAKGTVVQLAVYIARRAPGLRGFSPQNLWRMRQFFEMYRDDSKLSPLVRVLPWTHNLIILGQSKRMEERESSTCAWPSRSTGENESWNANSVWLPLSVPCSARQKRHQR